MRLTHALLREVIIEELTKTDKEEIRRIASREAEKVNNKFKTELRSMVEEELEKLLKKTDTKDQLAEITKKILKKLYKDLAIQHPYIIDRIKL